MILHDKAGKEYYDAEESMQRLAIKSRQTFYTLVKRHQLKRYGFYPNRRVFYKAEDIEYLATEETEDAVELPPLPRTGRAYRPDQGPIENVIIENEALVS